MHYCTIQIQVCNRNQDQWYDKPYFVTDNRTFILETDRCFYLSIYRGYTTKICDFSKFSFNKELSEVDWECILINPHKLSSTFYKKFNKIVNKHALITKLSKRKAKQLSKPWITTGLKVFIMVKNKLHVSGDEDKYKYYRNKICSQIYVLVKRYTIRIISNATKRTWKRHGKE